MSTILVVDDDDTIRSYLARALTRAGFAAVTAADGVEALEQVEATQPDLIVLDVLMPKANGREVLNSLRSRNDWTPVILLTGVGEARSRAAALEQGADDYLNKPFDAAELVARIRAVLRRGKQQQSLAQAVTLSGGGITVSRLDKTTSVAGVELKLTPKAQALLEYLMAHHGESFSRDHLLSQVWGVEFAVTTRAVDHRIGELRKAFARLNLDDPIDTVQSVGYRFHPKVTAE